MKKKKVKKKKKGHVIKVPALMTNSGQRLKGLHLLCSYRTDEQLDQIFSFS